MKVFSNMDFMYPVVGMIIALIMMLSPRALMRKVAHSEESIKTEDLLRKIGIVLMIACIGFAIYIYTQIP